MTLRQNSPANCRIRMTLRQVDGTKPNQEGSNTNNFVRDGPTSDQGALSQDVQKSANLTKPVNITGTLKSALKTAASTKPRPALPTKDGSLSSLEAANRTSAKPTVEQYDLPIESVKNRIRSLSAAYTDNGIGSLSKVEFSGTPAYSKAASSNSDQVQQFAQRAQREAERALQTRPSYNLKLLGTAQEAAAEVLQPKLQSPPQTDGTEEPKQGKLGALPAKKEPALHSSAHTESVPLASLTSPVIHSAVCQRAEEDEDDATRKAQLLKKVKGELELAVREGFQIVDREINIERRRRQMAEYRWAKSPTAVNDGVKRKIRRDWRQMDRVFLAKKRELLENVCKNFETKLLFAVGSKGEVRNLLRDEQQRIFGETVHEFIRRHTKPGELDQRELDSVFEKLLAETIKQQAYIKRSNTVENMLADSDSENDDAHGEEDMGSGASTPLNYEFSFTSLDSVNISFSPIPLAQATAISSAAILESQSEGQDDTPVLPFDALDRIRDAVSASCLEDKTPHPSFQECPQDANSPAKEEMCDPAVGQPQHFTSEPVFLEETLQSKESEQACELAADTSTASEAVRASIVMERVVGTSSSPASTKDSRPQSNVPSEKLDCAPKLETNIFQVQPVEAVKPAQTVTLSFHRGKPQAFTTFYTDVYDEAFIKEVVVPEVLSIVEDNHVIKASKILPYLLPAKSSAIKRMFNFWKPEKSLQPSAFDMNSSSNAVIAPVFQGSTQLTNSSANQSLGGALTASGASSSNGGAFKSLGRRLTMARKSFSSPTQAPHLSISAHGVNGDSNNVLPPGGLSVQDDANGSSAAKSPVQAVEQQAGGQIFGVALDELCAKDGCSVPLLVVQCIEYLEVNGLDTAGIFRVTPSNKKLDQFRSALERGEDPFRNGFAQSCGPHVVAGILKAFVRELPDPLLCGRLWKIWLKIGSIEDSVLRLRLSRLLITVLPTNSRHTLRAIVDLLKKVSVHAATSLMDAKNLATCFGPSICRPPGVPKVVPTASDNSVVSSPTGAIVEGYKPNSASATGAAASLANGSSLEAAIEGDVVMYRKITILVKTMIDQADFLFVLPEGTLAKYTGSSAAAMQLSLKRQSRASVTRSMSPPAPQAEAEERTASQDRRPAILEAVSVQCSPTFAEPASQAAAPIENSVGLTDLPATSQNGASSSSPTRPLNLPSMPPPNPPSPAFIARSNSSLRSPTTDQGQNKLSCGSVQHSSSALNNGSSLKNILANADLCDLTTQPGSLKSGLLSPDVETPTFASPIAAAGAASPAQIMQRRKTLKQRIGAKLGFS